MKEPIVTSPVLPPLPERTVPHIIVAQSDAEKEAVYRFRYDIYVREMGKTRMDDVDHGRLWLRDSLDDVAALYAALDEDGAVIGTLRVVNGGDRIPPMFTQVPHFDRFLSLNPAALSFTSRLMVSPGQRGGLAMTAMIHRAYSDGLAGQTHFDFCVCAPGLVDLYEHLGYRRFSGNLVDPVVGYQVPLVLAARDRDHLRAVQSPLLRLLRRYPEAGLFSGGQEGRSLVEGTGHQETQALLSWLADEVPVRSVVRDWVEQETTYWQFLAGKVRSSISGTASILEDLTESDQRLLLRGGTVLDCSTGDQIITSGSVGTEVFVVLSGLVEVRLPGNSEPIAVLDTGQVFGEIAFITDITRTADVVALTDARVLVLSQAMLKRMMRHAPDVAAKLMLNLSRVLCERLVTSNRRLMD